MIFLVLSYDYYSFTVFYLLIWITFSISSCVRFQPPLNVALNIGKPFPIIRDGQAIFQVQSLTHKPYGFIEMLCRCRHLY